MRASVATDRTRAAGWIGRLLAAGRDARLTLTIRDSRLGRVSFIAFRHVEYVLDAVAGCEYLDDRIRFNE